MQGTDAPSSGRPESHVPLVTLWLNGQVLRRLTGRYCLDVPIGALAMPTPSLATGFVLEFDYRNGLLLGFPYFWCANLFGSARWPALGRKEVIWFQ